MSTMINSDRDSNDPLDPDDSILLVGVSEFDVTPSNPVELAGFAARSGVSQGIDRPLYLRAFWFTSKAKGRPDESALVVTGDIIKWPSGKSDELRRQIAERWSVPFSHIVLNATHTHSGPQTATNATASADEAWTSFLFSQLFDAIDTAWKNRQIARIEIGKGPTNIGVNRRWLRGDELATAENPEGLIDREVIALRVAKPDGQPIAVLVHHACHPTIASGMQISSEYPGVMSEIIAEYLDNGAIVGFLQGCAGDINSYITRDRAVRKLDNHDVEKIGAEFASDVIRILEDPMESISVDRISADVTTATLPFQHVPTKDELNTMVDESGLRGSWARRMLNEPERLIPDIPMELIHLYLGNDLRMLAMPGEVTTPYGMRIKVLSDGATLPLAYSNGMIGYIVTAAQLDEGGYEAEESTRYSGMPSPFSSMIESNLNEAIDTLLNASVERDSARGSNSRGGDSPA